MAIVPPAHGDTECKGFPTYILMDGNGTILRRLRR